MIRAVDRMITSLAFKDVIKYCLKDFCGIEKSYDDAVGLNAGREFKENMSGCIDPDEKNRTWLSRVAQHQCLHVINKGSDWKLSEITKVSTRIHLQQHVPHCTAKEDHFHVSMVVGIKRHKICSPSNNYAIVSYDITQQSPQAISYTTNNTLHDKLVDQSSLELSSVSVPLMNTNNDENEWVMCIPPTILTPEFLTLLKIAYFYQFESVEGATSEKKNLILDSVKDLAKEKFDNNQELKYYYNFLFGKTGLNMTIDGSLRFLLLSDESRTNEKTLKKEQQNTYKLPASILQKFTIFTITI